MEKIARIIAKKISTFLNYNNEQEEVITYGMIALIQIVITIILVIFLGGLLNVLTEALIITFSISVLRKYSGGVHVSSLEFCMAVGVIYSIVFAWISKYLLAPVMNYTFMIIIDIIVFIVSYLIIYRLAPVDSPNKPIVTDKKKKRMRKGSYIILAVYLAGSILFILLSINNIFWAGCFISLIFGVIWQINTLTSFGARCIHKIDSLFNKPKTT